MFFEEVRYIVVRDADNRPILSFRYEDVLSIGPHPDQNSCCIENNSPPIHFACPWYIYAATVVLDKRNTCTNIQEVGQIASSCYVARCLKQHCAPRRLQAGKLDGESSPGRIAAFMH